MNSTNGGKKKVLVLVDWFSPGYKAGGPIRSCVNFAMAMKESHGIFVLTGDRDLGEEKPYPNITPNEWTTRNGVQTCYLSPEKRGFKDVKRMIQELDPDFIYINILFSKTFSIFPLLLSRRGSIRGQVVICPRGMLLKEGLAIKSRKKQIFLTAFKALGLHKKVKFHATTKDEEVSLKALFGSRIDVTQVANFPEANQPAFEQLPKVSGQVKLVYLSRIHPIKNLHYVLEELTRTEADISLDIFGPVEDHTYWVQCQDLMRKTACKVEYKGPLSHAMISTTLKAYHFFVLPTLSENFGHAIFEALLAGKPVLIANTTPWTNLKPQQLGWDYALENPSELSSALQEAVDMDGQTYGQWSKTTWEFAGNFTKNSNFKEKYNRIFS